MIQADKFKLPWPKPSLTYKFAIDSSAPSTLLPPSLLPPSSLHPPSFPPPSSLLPLPSSIEFRTSQQSKGPNPASSS